MDLWITSKILTLKFCLALQFYTVFYNPQNLYHKNAETMNSQKFWLLKYCGHTVYTSYMYAPNTWYLLHTHVITTRVYGIAMHTIDVWFQL